jgi:hypothetical protein
VQMGGVLCYPAEGDQLSPGKKKKTGNLRKYFFFHKRRDIYIWKKLDFFSKQKWSVPPRPDFFAPVGKAACGNFYKDKKGKDIFFFKKTITTLAYFGEGLKE